jgi:hypothetical protein
MTSADWQIPDRVRLSNAPETGLRVAIRALPQREKK